MSLPFWSPDSTRIGFFAGRKLKTVAVTGGAATVVCDAPFGSRRDLEPIERDCVRPRRAGTAPSRLRQRRRGDANHRPRRVPEGGGPSLSVLSSGRRAVSLCGDPRGNGASRDFRGLDRRRRRPDADRVAGERAGLRGPGLAVVHPAGCAVRTGVRPKALRLTGEPVSLGDEPGVAPDRPPTRRDRGRRRRRRDRSRITCAPVVDIRVQWMDYQGQPDRHRRRAPRRDTRTSRSRPTARKPSSCATMRRRNRACG